VIDFDQTGPVPIGAEEPYGFFPPFIAERNGIETEPFIEGRRDEKAIESLLLLLGKLVDSLNPGHDRILPPDPCPLSVQPSEKRSPRPFKFNKSHQMAERFLLFFILTL
jgi:hypothetical protein